MPGLFLWPGEFGSDASAQRLSVWLVFISRAKEACTLVSYQMKGGDNNNASEADDSKFYLAQHRKVCVHIRIRDLNVGSTHNHSNVSAETRAHVVALTQERPDRLHSVIFSKTYKSVSELVFHSL